MGDSSDHRPIALLKAWVAAYLLGDPDVLNVVAEATQRYLDAGTVAVASPPAMERPESPPTLRQVPLPPETPAQPQATPGAAPTSGAPAPPHVVAQGKTEEEMVALQTGIGKGDVVPLPGWTAPSRRYTLPDGNPVPPPVLIGGIPFHFCVGHGRYERQDRFYPSNRHALHKSCSAFIKVTKAAQRAERVKAEAAKASEEAMQKLPDSPATYKHT